MNVRLRWPGTLLVAVLLAGCASPSARFYTLLGSPPIESSAGPSVAVGPITIPAVVDRPEIVVTLGSNEVWPDEFNRWASPLTDAIGLALVQDLSADLRSPRVTLASATAANPEYRVAVEVQRFESRLGSHALLDAAWTVRRTRDGAVREGRTTWREPATGDTSYDALAAAHSRALRGLARNVADAIDALRAPVAATPSPAR